MFRISASILAIVTDISCFYAVFPHKFSYSISNKATAVFPRSYSLLVLPFDDIGYSLSFWERR
jgi:hypothetical protein